MPGFMAISTSFLTRWKIKSLAAPLPKGMPNEVINRVKTIHTKPKKITGGKSLMGFIPDALRAMYSLSWDIRRVVSSGDMNATVGIIIDRK